MSRTLSKQKSMKALTRTPESDKEEGGKDEKADVSPLDLKDLRLGGVAMAWTVDSPSTPKTGIQYLQTKTEETGIASIAKNCKLLQELDLFQCTDETLRAIAACENLQIVRLIGSVTGFYHCTFTDIGLTIMSHTFRRLVRLELSGCEASYEGISAIGRCCVMLEELTISNKGFYEGWVAALSFLDCLKTLRLEGCKQIDRNPGSLAHMGKCSAIERLHLERCDLRDRAGFAALLSVCSAVKELEFKDCWGLDDDTLALIVPCRRVRLLNLEGCSLITTAGVDSVVQSFKDLNRLRVTFCDNIRDSELSPALCDRFLTLKEFSWRPDTKSVLKAGLAGTGVGQKGGKFFRRT
jgi:F-box/leucine-rich repeat protein 2/20